MNESLKEPTMPDTGQIAPDFTLPDENDEPVTLTALRPAPVVLYFYPKDDTPGCTKEAIAFSGLLDQFQAAGARVFGVSKDSVTKHTKFICKYELSVPLLSDQDGTVCEDYGVWVEKNMYGKKYMGIERATFLIAADGTIAQVWRKVKVPGHAEAVLEAVQAI